LPAQLVNDHVGNASAGAALIPALAFMFASTNLVIELGAVLWILMGWQFVLAEILGAFVLIILMWILIRLFLPKRLEAQIRVRAEQKQAESHCHSARPHSLGPEATGEHEHDYERWRTRDLEMDASSACIRDRLVDALERNSWRFFDSRSSGDADATRLVGSFISAERTACGSPDRKCTRRPELLP
jgi:uncharacterized membrane protein YraQ (UPF0718 family)